MLTVAFAGTFAASLAPPVRAHLGIPCDIRVTDEAGIVDKLEDVDVLVAMAFTREMAAAARRLKLVQVPGAGLERIDRAARSARDGLARLGGLDILDEVLRRSDYLAITLPATAATRGLLGAAQLALMKPTAVLVNVARAEIVDEQALYRALAERAIAAAALDVWNRHPTDAPRTPAARPAVHELANALSTQ